MYKLLKILYSIKLVANQTPQAMRRIPVSDIEQRVKQAVAEQLGLKAEEIKTKHLSWMTWVLTL